eukprot:122932_1
MSACNKKPPPLLSEYRISCKTNTWQIETVGNATGISNVADCERNDLNNILFSSDHAEMKFLENENKCVRRKKKTTLVLCRMRFICVICLEQKKEKCTFQT